MKIAIIIPCYNEAVTIAKVIRDFRASIPEADIHVFDNLSADGTGDIARAAGAIVHLVPVQGKGAVVRQMFRDIECDIGVMVDGDDTYPADKVRLLIQPVIEGRAEMVVLSGYRAFSTRFMSTTPVLSKGFEIETEITLHALEHHMPIVEVPVPYGVRPDGSESKLHTFRDGYRVLKAILWLYKDYRPLLFFGMLSTGLLFVALLMGGVIVEEFLDKGSVAPARAMFAAALGLVGVVAFSTGMVLDTVNRRARELNILISDQLISRSRR